MTKNIVIDFMPPGMLEFSVADVTETTEGTGYGPVGLTDLQVDRDVKTGEPLAYIAYNFHQTFFDILRAVDEADFPYRYDVLEADLHDLSLHQVLTWIYVHYVLDREALKIAA